MSNEAGARRASPLAHELKEEISRNGPITIAAYMQACLQHRVHGYYRKATAIGAAGDFITAPEISQVFGEIVGLWAAVVWQQIGRPDPFCLVELGPGRGTLMADALRAGRLVRGFIEAAQIALIETNARLRAAQDQMLSGRLERVTWHETLAEVAPGPAIVIANEFLDALPIRQFVRRETGLFERLVGLSAESELTFVDSPEPELDISVGRGLRLAPGDIIEVRAGYEALAANLAERAAAAPLAALFVDYGYTEPAPGKTLQAVRRHRAEHPLCSPGEADLTAHVDFSNFACAITAAAGRALASDGPVTQAEFLGALGIMERASRLMAANPARAHEIEAGVVRLMAVPGIGDRFKAIGVRSRALPPLPGLSTAR